MQLTTFWETTYGVNGLFTYFGLNCIVFAVVAFKCVRETHGKTYKEAILLKAPTTYAAS